MNAQNVSFANVRKDVHTGFEVTTFQVRHDSHQPVLHDKTKVRIMEREDVVITRQRHDKRVSEATDLTDTAARIETAVLPMQSFVATAL